MRRLRLFSWVLILCVASGCAVWNRSEPSDYRTIETSPHHDSDASRRKNDRALDLLEKGDLAHAERAFQEALIADVTFAPAHNNLGQLYFQQGKMYLAAWEFEYAKELMEGRPEPYNNLGLVFEAVGRMEQAVEMYELAYGMEPQNPEYIGNLARARLRRGETDAAIGYLLDELRFYDTRPQWVAWANEQLAMGKITPMYDLDESSQPISPNELEILPSPVSSIPSTSPEPTLAPIYPPTPTATEPLPLVAPVHTSWIAPLGTSPNRVQPASFEFPAESE